MFKAIKNLFKGNKKEESLFEVKIDKEFREQETLEVWYKTLQLHYGKDTFYFVVNYKISEMVKISHQLIEVDNHNSEFVFILNENTIVDSLNIRRTKKLLTALYKYYRKDNSISIAEQIAFEEGQSVVFN